MDLNSRIIKIINKNEIDIINEKINYNKFEKIKEEMKIHTKVQVDIDLKLKKELINYIYRNDKFNFAYFTNYYSQKLNNFNLQNIERYDKIYDINYYIIQSENIKKILIEACSSLQELSKITQLLKHYDKINIIMNNLIKANYSNINDHNILKNILAPVFFKLKIKRELYSKYKMIKKIFNERESMIFNINKVYPIIDKIDEVQFNYNNDKILSSGEKIVDEHLLKLYEHTDSLLYYCNEYILPIKFKKNLRADFFCLIIDKNNKIKKLIIEVNGDQHYMLVHFYNNSNNDERDELKKKYCRENDIGFLEIKYNQLCEFPEIINQIILM